MLGAAAPARALLEGAPIDAIEASFAPSLAAYEAARERIRLYPSQR
jgi:hypothetical protein